MFLLSLLCPFALADEPPPPPNLEDVEVIAPINTPSIQLIWTGGHGGIGAGRYAFRMVEQLERRSELSEVHAVHGWLANGPWLLAADSRRVEDALNLLDGDGPACTPADEGHMLRTTVEALVVRGPLPDWSADWNGVHRDLRTWTCTNGDVSGVLYGPKDGPAQPKSYDVSTWEFRLGLSARTTNNESSYDFIGIPEHEGTRRFSALQRATEVQGALYVDAGDFVDGVSSVRNDRLSLHRPAAFAMLHRLKPAALAPGETELAGGARSLLDEATGLPYIASNWRSEDPTLSLPDHKIVEVEHDGKTVRVGFTAALDPTLIQGSPKLTKEGITLADPVSSVQQTVDALNAQDPPVDLIVLLTTASPTVLSDLRTRVRGVDLIIGDTHARMERLAAFNFLFQPARLTRTSTSATMPVHGIVASSIYLSGSGELSELRALPLPVLEATQPDPRTLAAVSSVRAREYPPLDHPLLPTPADAPTSSVDDATWSKVVCEAVREHTQADVVLLPALPSTKGVRGPLTELQVVDRLAISDHIEVHAVPGARLKRLLDQAYGTIPVSCGSPLGQKKPKARGRLLEDERVYRLATTDRMRQSTNLGGLLQGAHSPRHLDQPGYESTEGVDGSRTTLRSAVLESLRELRQTHGDALLGELTRRSPDDKPPQWLLRVRQASIKVEGFQGANDDAYSEVPETLVTSPSSFTLGSGLDVALDYSSARFNWDVRARSMLTRLTTDGETQETADDLKLSTSTKLPGVATPPVLGLAFSPYAEALFDSEWTPIDDTVPRQADASLTVGLALKRQGVLRVLRLGVLTNQDLAVPSKKAEIGGRVEAQTRVGFGPGLVWTNQLDGFVYGNTDDQDASDLRFKATLDSRMALPLSGWLSITMYGRGFAFQGRVDSTSAVRWSGSLGAALDISGALSVR
ncbi:MAG: hypothetical protein ACI9MC_003492 [Kiritimatiellia bacterium]|jgi:hypothetical protein